MILAVTGGVGIFLIGMLLMSEGLKSAAGGALRSVLQRFARTPGRALASGAVVTVVVQSSSATTLTTIGFVSAGLLTFPQAVGLIFGANLGTTSTGWIVSVLGLKVSMGEVALPFIGIGALLRLLGRGRWSHGGMALAGFGLIFVGIDILQEGMMELADRVDPTTLPGASFLGRMLLVVIGVAMTIVMQSSSAAVATTITAVHAGGLGLEQAAFLVVGQNVGTSIKAMLAAIGGSVPVKRTALAHILFNLLTALFAIVLLPLLLRGSVFVAGSDDPAIAIAVFHTAFSLLGVAIFFPIVDRFARWVEMLVPEVRPSLTRNLDRSFADIPDVAVEASRRSAITVGRVLFDELARILRQAAHGRPTAGGGSDRVDEILPALAELRTFLAGVRTDHDNQDAFRRHLSVIHALDHLERLEERRSEFEDIGDLPSDLAATALQVAEVLEAGLPDEADGLGDAEALGRLSRALADDRRARRARTLEETAAGIVAPDAGRLDILHVKRMDRLAYHAWRAAHHLGRLSSADGAPGNPDQFDEDDAPTGA